MESKSIELLSLTGYLYLQHSKPREAIAILEAVEALDPESTWVGRALAYAYLQNHEFQQCLDAVARCNSDLSSRDHLDWMKCRALMGLGRTQEARRLAANLSRTDEGSDG